MKPLLDQSFWSDPDIESVSPAVKLTALWLFTNPQTSLLGLCAASTGRFVFETGLTAQALEEALEALPRAFVKVGNVIFIRNYVRYQFGSGEKLTRNNFFVALKSQFLAVKDEALQAVILQEYPELELARKGFEGLTKPKDGKDDKDGKERKGTREPQKTPEEIIEKLRENPAYAMLDLYRELGKMRAWLDTPAGRGRHLSHKFIVNWLNKCDAPLNGAPPPSTPQERAFARR